MKSKFFAALVAICILMALSLPAAAAQPLNLYIDNAQVPTEPGYYYDENGERQSTYYMDVQPQLQEGRTYVPIQVISKYWGTKIVWQSPRVLLTYGDTSLSLTLGSKTALKNDSELTLEAAPYAKNGRIMVPLRFMAEAFDCQVNYVNGKVYIATPPLYIDGKEVVSLQSRMRMTMGGITDECKNNYYIKQFYQILNSNEWQETVAPDYYGPQLNMDVPFFYYLGRQYSFMESPGIDGSVIQQFHTYKCMNDWGESNKLAALIGTDLGDWLLYDVNHNKWYKLNWDDYQKGLRNIPAGAWQEILNDVV